MNQKTKNNTFNNLFELGLKQGIEIGLELGVQHGIEVCRIEVIKTMFDNHESVEKISKYTNLSVSEVKKIK